MSSFYYDFDSMENLIPLETAAKHYGMTPLQLGQEIAKGRLKAVQIGYSLYFREDDLIDYEIRKETVYG